MKNNERDTFFDVENWNVVIDMKAVRKEVKKRAKKLEREARAEKRREWVKRNIGVILTVAPFAVGAVTAVARTTANVVRTANRKSMLDKEQQMKDLYCYDRSLGHYWQLKRKLSNSDWVKINERRSAGETLANILADMNVLK